MSVLATSAAFTLFQREGAEARWGWGFLGLRRVHPWEMGIWGEKHTLPVSPRVSVGTLSPGTVGEWEMSHITPGS